MTYRQPTAPRSLFESGRSGCALALAAVLALSSASLAQSPDKPAAREGSSSPDSEGPGDLARAAAAAVSVLAMSSAPGAIGVLCAGRGTSMWDGLVLGVPEPVGQRHAASRIDPDLLRGVEDRAPVRSLQENPDEVQAYIYLLVQARATSAQALGAGARRDLTYAHLFEEPAKYRGQIVHVEGRLKRLRQFDAPAFAAQQGVPHVYEGWVFADISSRHPYCVLSTDLPAGIQVGERIDYPVVFDGYFFKRYRYQSDRGWQDALLLIGRTLLLGRDPPASASETSVANALGPGVMGLIVATLGVAVGLGWWYRRNDRLVRLRLAKTRVVRFAILDPAEATRSQRSAEGEEDPPPDGVGSSG